MYLALVVIVLGVLGINASMALVGGHGFGGLVVVVLANALVFLFGLYHKKVEARARALHVGAEHLTAEYRSVADAWVRKPWPDFQRDLRTLAACRTRRGEMIAVTILKMLPVSCRAAIRPREAGTSAFAAPRMLSGTVCSPGGPVVGGEGV